MNSSNASSFITSVYTNLMSGYSDDTVESLGTENLSIPSFSEDTLFDLCENAISFYMERTSNRVLLRLTGETIIVGDLHGNLHDLIRIWNSIPDDVFNFNILFLGDYVDRGQFQLETITLLLALKVEYPDNVFLLRGNHEFMSVNQNNGFKNEMVEISGYSEKLWEKFNEVFTWIPIASVINDSIFCVHGGLSPLLTNIKQIEENFTLPITEFNDNQLLTDLMWSDPTNDCETYMISNRGTGMYFGFLATFQFLQRNELKMMVRAHESINGGVRLMHDSKCITVFSSSGYMKGNLAGYIHIDMSGNRNSYRMKPIPKVNRADAKFYQPVQKIKVGLSLHNMLTDQMLYTSKSVLKTSIPSSNTQALTKRKTSKIVRPVLAANISLLNSRRKSGQVSRPYLKNSGSVMYL